MATFSEISFEKLYNQVTTFLKNTYNKSGKVFRTSSPFGQILRVVVELFQWNILNLKHSNAQWDINNPLNNNKKSIRALAVLGGHDPARATSAYGTLRLMLKNGVNVSEEIKGSAITVFNLSRIRNESNNLLYSVDLGTDKISFAVEANKPINLPIVQGVWETQTFTGTGEAGQSFNVTVSGDDEIDNDRFTVEVNSDLCTRKGGLYKMLPNEKAFYSHTGIAGGIDVFFGNEDWGFIPPLGSKITVTYLVTSGRDGNIFNPKINEFKFVDEVFDGQGNSVDMDTNFNVLVDNPITFGGDGESIQFTKALLPLASGNGTLSRPEHFEFHLKRHGTYSIVNAYMGDSVQSDLVDKMLKLQQDNTKLLYDASTNRGIDYGLRRLITNNLENLQVMQKQLLSSSGTQVINIFLVPNVSILYGRVQNLDYFDIPTDAFILDDTEKQRVLDYLKNQGKISLRTSLNIVTPQIKRYVANVTLRLYENANEDNIRSQVRSALSNYMLTLERRDRVPPSDFIRLIEDFDDVDSVDCNFISEATEKYHAEYREKHEQFFRKNLREPNVGEIFMNDGSLYDSNKIIGVDPILGDAVFAQDSLFMLRGGWFDRNKQYYADGINSKGLSSVNVIILKEKTKRKPVI